MQKYYDKSTMTECQHLILSLNKSRAIAGRTAWCCCKIQCVLNLTTASWAVSRLSCISLHQRHFKCWNYSTL